MAVNKVAEGRIQSWAVASKSSGDPVINGTMTGVCLGDTDADGNVQVDTMGVYDLSVKAIDDDGSSAVSIGDKLFYVSGDTPVLSKKDSGYFFGFALEAISSGSTDTINVLQIQGPGPGTADILAGVVGTSELADDAVTTAKILAENVTLAKLADLSQGSIISGQASDRPTALDASGDGKILVGDGTDVNSVSVSGDVTLANTGAVTIAAEAVEPSMMADLARGSLLSGQTANNRPTALDAKGDAKLLVGDGTDLNSVSMSGDVAIDNTGATTIQAEAVETSMMADLARGSILTGQASDRPAALDAKASGQILVGDGTDLASVAVSGDVTLAANGAVTIAAGAVESSMLASGAGVAAMLASGLGSSAAYDQDTAGAQTLLASDVAARVALIMVVVDETFADGDGGQSVFTIGETDAPTSFTDGSDLADATAGDIFLYAGSLTAAKNLLVTGTAATGTGTGGISVTAIVLPAAA